jgi:hypothetical protein
MAEDMTEVGLPTSEEAEVARDLGATPWEAGDVVSSFRGVWEGLDN